jgi:predicted PilT family ATPase
MYWQIRELNVVTTRPLPLLSSAFGSLARWLCDIERELKRIASHDECTGSSATRIVLDSSALVRGTCFSEVPWTDVLQADEVKVFLPILVIRELDDLKNGGREPKARLRLKKIREILGNASTGPARVREGVTLQLLMDPPRHVRLPVNDQEITRRGKYLAGRPGGPLTLITGDYTQEFVARAEGLQAMTLPDELTREALK